jgi:hypothetical protein
MTAQHFVGFLDETLRLADADSKGSLARLHFGGMAFSTLGAVFGCGPADGNAS